MKTKEALRKKYRDLRNRLNDHEISEKSEAIIQNIINTDVFRRAKTVMLYRALKNEVSLDYLTANAASAGKRFVYPVCISSGVIKAYLPEKWKKGAFGIIEPDPEKSEEVPAECIDLVICPGVAFDKDRRRLGMGGGYYDRFLPECKNALFIMAAFECQKCDKIPADPSDITMNAVITESKTYKGE